MAESRAKSRLLSVNSTDKGSSETISSTMDTEYTTSDDKALKKKMKKERQRDKKNRGKEKSEENLTEGDVNKCESVASATSNDEARDCDEKIVDDVNIINDDDSDDKRESDIDEMSAFIRSIVNQKDSSKTQKKKGKDGAKDMNHKADNVFPDDSDGFTCVKKGGKQAPVRFCRTPEGFANQALIVINDGNFPLAVNYLSRAINLDPTDTRHYINRSYCYLRTGHYALALDDIRFASEHFSDVTELAKAKCREGQALCGLQNYEAAEMAFKDCINLMPNCLYAKRELKYMQVLQMVHMGFNERDALMALEKQSDTMEAINLLMERSSNNDHYDSTGSISDDELFVSDSEENPSNERLLSKILNYDPNLPDEPILQEPPPPSNKTINNVKQAPRALSADRALRVIKTVAPPGKLKNNPAINEMAVWVGNVPTQITEAMIQKRFGRFGKVTLVWRPPGATYVFVNFQCSSSSQKVIDEASYNGGNIELNGCLLPIKPAAKKPK